jgi:hypothetical protein
MEPARLQALKKDAESRGPNQVIILPPPEVLELVVELEMWRLWGTRIAAIAGEMPKEVSMDSKASDNQSQAIDQQ